MSRILDGKKLAQTIRAELKQKVEALDFTIGLVDILVGENSASEAYIQQKGRAAESVGMRFECVRLPENATESELIEAISRLNRDPHIHGILVQLPLPQHLNARSAIDAIDPRKDVDGFTRERVAEVFLGGSEGIVSCTPKGIMRLLKEHRISVQGKNVVIIGRSNIVGKPLTLMMMNAGATVTCCNSRTQNLREITKNADILISAVGKPRLVTPEMVKNNAVVIDVGISRGESGIVGDIDYDGVLKIAEAVTPVPGGVGPMTVAMLLENTYLAALALKNAP